MNTAPRPRLTPAALALAAAFSSCGQPLAAPPPAITGRAPDAFYDPPAEVPYRPGSLLRQEPLTDAALPAGMRAWRILYTTPVNDRTPATAVATVFAPIEAPPGPAPVITWTHAATGLLQRCMPSLTSAPAMGIPATARLAQEGWVIVATDYSFAEKGGPHPYLIGEGEARAALDALRAARRMPELKLSPRTVVWGHSQGGHAALWTGITAPRYAPDLEVVGVAAIAPMANMPKIMAMNPAVERRLGPYLAKAYSRFYPDVDFDTAVRAEALPAAKEIVGLCDVLPPQDPQRIAEPGASFTGPALTTKTYPAFRLRLAENAAYRPIAAPLLIAQGLADAVVPPAATQAYVEERCAAGQQLEYWRLAGLDHASIVRPGSRLEAPLLAWTAARFAGEPQPKGCPRRDLAMRTPPRPSSAGN
jgi:pimeloyl-ACP methyl ester carboxylesterase